MRLVITQFAPTKQPPAAARARRFAAKNAPAGQRQTRRVLARNVRAGHWDDYFPALASASGSGQRRLREKFAVSLPCGADRAWIYRASPPPSTL
jgi:hypothetical protein